MQVKSWGGFSIIIWSFELRSGRVLVVESSDAGEVMCRFVHNHMILWSNVKSYVGG